MTPRPEVDGLLESGARRVEGILDRLLPRGGGMEEPLYEAMRYACLGGGTRLRPFLVQTTAALFGAAESRALRTAAAVEMLHCYSLIHDDLPACDDEDRKSVL